MAETLKNIKKTENGEKNRMERKIYAPVVDIIETDNNIFLIADMPGVDEKSIDITIDKNLLKIHGMIDSSIHDDFGESISEYYTGDYQRVFSLSDKIDSTNIKATVKDGVLKLILPKSVHVKTRKIHITGKA